MTTSSPSYDRTGSSGVYYYEAIQVNVSMTGSYTIRSVSNVDTYGYLYVNSFNPSNTALNLITQDDDSAGNLQFLMQSSLQSTNRYILVVTTYSVRMTASYSVTVTGPSRAYFNGPNMGFTSTATAVVTTARFGNGENFSVTR